MPPLIKELKKKEVRKCYLIRHGETALNAEKKIRAWSDVPLNEEGFEQARDLGKQLKGSSIDILIASDLTRTLQTSAIVSEESGIPLFATSMALRPLNVGKFTAQPQDKVFDIIKDYALHKPDETLPEGESFTSFKYRCLMGIVAFLNQYPDKNIAFVAHHRNDRLLRAWVEAGCQDDLELDNDHFFDWGIEPGEVDEFEITSNYLT